MRTAEGECQEKNAPFANSKPQSVNPKPYPKTQVPNTGTRGTRLVK